MKRVKKARWLVVIIKAGLRIKKAIEWFLFLRERRRAAFHRSLCAVRVQLAFKRYLRSRYADHTYCAQPEE